MPASSRSYLWCYDENLSLDVGVDTRDHLVHVIVEALQDLVALRRDRGIERIPIAIDHGIGSQPDRGRGLQEGVGADLLYDVVPLSTLLDLRGHRAHLEQFEIAERSNLPRLVEASLLLKLRIFKALLTSTPLIKSATNLIFRGEIGEFLSCAIAIAFFDFLSSSALKRFLAPMTVINS